MCCALGLLAANAEIVTYTPSSKGYANAEKVTSVTEGDITFTFAKGTGSTDPAYYTSGTALRLYGSNTAKIAAPEGGTISQVVFNVGSGTKTFTPDQDPTTAISVSNKKATWTASAAVNNVTFTLASGSGNNQVTSIEVTYTPGVAPDVLSPVVTCENNMVTITCATEGADIYYTVNGTEPTNASTKYDKPFAITENTTVNAIAYKDGEYSSITTFAAQYVGTYPGFAEFVAGGNGTEGTVTGPITAVYQNGQYLYVVDSKNYPMLVYGSVNTTLTNGDQIASVEGKYSPYSGLPEVTSPVLGTVTKGGTPVEPTVVAVAELSNDMLNKYLEFQDMTVKSATQMVDSEGKSVTLYSRFTGVTVPADLTKTYTVRGFLAIYNNNLQLYFTEFIEKAEFGETVATPTFNPAAGVVEAGTKVEIACATAGATIYYTTDGMTPTEDSEEYTTAIEISATTTIKAIAVADGMNNSAIASATYTVVNPDATDATFDFTDPSSLGVTLAGDVSEYDLTGKTLTSGVVSLYSEATASASNKPRLFLATGNNAGWTYRFYKDNTITLSIEDGFAITSIEFTGTNLNNASVVYSDNGTFANGIWTATSDKGVSSMTVTKTETGSNPSITKIVVNYTKDSSGVGSVVTEDENAPVEYFNLQGVRVNNPAAGQLLIKRQGNTVTKVLVK